MVRNDSKIVYKIGFMALLVAAFCWGYNSEYFND